MSYKEAWYIMKLRIMEDVKRYNQFMRTCISAGLHDVANIDAQKVDTLRSVIDNMHMIELIIGKEKRWNDETANS